MTRQTRPFASARARSSSNVRRLRRPVSGSVTAAFSRCASLASAPARARRRMHPQQHEQRRRAAASPTGNAASVSFQARSCVAAQRGERRRGLAALRQARRCSARREPRRRPPLRATRPPCPAAGASARRSAASACARCAHARGRARAARGARRVRVTARGARRPVVAAAKLVRAGLARPAARARAAARWLRSAGGRVLRPDRDAGHAGEQRDDRDDRRCARRAGRVRSLVNARSRATLDSSAGTARNCGGSASLERGTLTLKFGMPSAENGSVRARHLHANRHRRSPLCAVAPGDRAGAPARRAVTRASAVASIPPDYLALYQKWGSAYGVPWQLLAAVGSVESRHGRDPGAYVPHTRGVLGPMQFQAGSNKARAARRRAPATRASAAPGASGASPPGIRPTAWTTPTTRSRRQRPRSRTTRARRASGRARSGATTRCTPTARPCCAARRASA